MSFSVDTKLQRRLQDVSKRMGKTPDAILTEALTLYLEQKERSFASLGACDNPTLDARQTKELLKNWRSLSLRAQ